MPGFNIHRLLMDVFAPSPGETVLVMADLPHDSLEDTRNWQERREMAESWRQAFPALGLKVLPLATFAATGGNNADLPESIRVGDRSRMLEELLPEVNILLAFTQFSATAPLSRFVRQIPTLRAASMPGVLKRMEQTALAADYSEVARKVRILAEHLTRADAAEVEFSTGDTCRFDLRHRRGLEDNGRCHAGDAHRLINLPSGEAFIVPYEGEREGDPSQTEGRIPVTVQDEGMVYVIRENRIVEVEGAGPRAEETRAYFAADSARRNVAELGLGCNDRAIVAGCVLEDEKAGFHWAYGRSEHLGGTVGPDSFSHPSHVVHQDIVYAEGCPHTIERLTVQDPQAGPKTLIHRGAYTL